MPLSWQAPVRYQYTCAIPPGTLARYCGRNQKKRDTREAWRIRNDELWEAHQAEIKARRAAGQRPSEIAVWLNTLGFTGSGGRLNGYLKNSWSAKAAKPASRQTDKPPNRQAGKLINRQTDVEQNRFRAS